MASSKAIASEGVRDSHAALPTDRILVVSASPIAELETMTASGGRPHVVGTLEEALTAMKAGSTALVFVDEALLDGWKSVSLLREAAPTLVVVALVETPDPFAISRALSAGADTVTLRHSGQINRLLSQELALGIKSKPLELPGPIVGASGEMLEVWRLVLLASRAEVSVLVTGETGAGKEIVARALHRLSVRRAGPFVAVNCAALPETLLESELFGHEKGAFTGASTRHKGRFELAHGGTLFLDEIGDLPPSLQAKLLRVLQEHTFERVGGTEPITVDVRVVAATHRELGSEIARGSFRADLFYRLSVLSLHVPALRRRKADVLPLWSHFLSQGWSRLRDRPLETGMAVKRRLVQHEWPGNVRELYNVAQHALTVAAGPELTVEELPAYLRGESLPQRPESTSNLVGMTMKDVERIMIEGTYQVAGTVKATAEMLGISVRTVHYRLREYKSHDGAGRSAHDKDGALLEGERKSRHRVFLAEDDTDLRLALTDFLESEGYDVLAMPDGDALLKQVGAAMLVEREGSLPDLVISDLRMPGATGLQFLEGIRARGSRIPVVLMTAFGDFDTRERAKSLGATAFLDKPIDLGALEGIIRTLM